jgi:ATP-binding cassette subfamily B multidrug efflux pump
VKKGQKIALVGATGAGKTSIINTLSRSYEYNKGSITIDGTELRDFDPDYLSRQVGVVLQDVFLFSDSIYNNITLNNPKISRELVEEAANKVGAHRFIDRLPEGYDFNVKERGGMLSVGQRQLLAFIRAYIYNPAILILDEATSSVDTETETMIQEAIEQITKDRTSIIIAHRLATVQHADIIMVMEKGEIVEMGSHQELLRKDGHYKNLYDLQFV